MQNSNTCYLIGFMFLVSMSFSSALTIIPSLAYAQNFEETAETPREIDCVVGYERVNGVCTKNLEGE